MNIRNAVALTIVTAGFRVAVIMNIFVLQHDSVEDCQPLHPRSDTVRQTACFTPAAEPQTDTAKSARRRSRERGRFPISPLSLGFPLR
jgi:hypothetical protein